MVSLLKIAGFVFGILIIIGSLALVLFGGAMGETGIGDFIMPTSYFCIIGIILGAIIVYYCGRETPTKVEIVKQAPELLPPPPPNNSFYRAKNAPEGVCEFRVVCSDYLQECGTCENNHFRKSS